MTTISTRPMLWRTPRRTLRRVRPTATSSRMSVARIMMPMCDESHATRCPAMRQGKSTMWVTGLEIARMSVVPIMR